MAYINCKKCIKQFWVPRCRLISARYCSIVCAKETLFKKGQNVSVVTQFKSGHTFWLGKKRPYLKGNKEALEKSPYRQKNELHPGWKGDKVGYAGIHSWLRRNFVKPNVCQNCEEQKELQWANISHEYKRDIKDYVALCRVCHSYYDREHGWGDAWKKFGRKYYT